MRRIAVLVLALFGTLLIAVPAQAADGTRFASLTFGRNQFSEGQFTPGQGCDVHPNAFTMLDIAEYAKSKGLNGLGGNVIIDRVSPQYPNKRLCLAGDTHVYSSFNDTKLLRDKYGWRHSTSGTNYLNMAKLTVEEQFREACGALKQMRAWGFYSAAGMFAAASPESPNLTDEAVSTIRKCGYVKARDYGQVTWQYGVSRPNGDRIGTNVLGNLHRLGYYRSNSINGGSCPSTWQCWAGGARDYMEPEEIISDLRDSPPNSHMIIQVYRLVRGDVAGKWKCTGDNHRTYTAETYCWTDYKKVLDWLAASNYTVTDPLTVFKRWGLY